MNQYDESLMVEDEHIPRHVAEDSGVVTYHCDDFATNRRKVLLSLARGNIIACNYNLHRYKVSSSTPMPIEVFALPVGFLYRTSPA